MPSFQYLTKSVLNQQSPEVWRKTAGESKFWLSAGLRQCRGLRAKARVYWGFLRAGEPAENILCGATGGGRVTRIQHSPRSPAKIVALPRNLCGPIKRRRAWCASGRGRGPLFCTSQASCAARRRSPFIAAEHFQLCFARLVPPTRSFGSSVASWNGAWRPGAFNSLSRATPNRLDLQSPAAR